MRKAHGQKNADRGYPPSGFRIRESGIKHSADVLQLRDKVLQVLASKFPSTLLPLQANVPSCNMLVEPGNPSGIHGARNQEKST